MADKKSQKNSEELAKKGRGSDTALAHLTPGEVVIPRDFMRDQEFQALLRDYFDQNGAHIGEFTVGDKRNKINPETGNPEFVFGIGRFLKKKIARPITKALGPVAPLAPIALGLLTGGLGLGAGTLLGTTGTGALLGGAGGYLSSGGDLKGALAGSLGGFGAAGGAAQLGNALGYSGASASGIGGAALGGTAGALTGGSKGALTGAALGGAGGYLSGGGLSEIGNSFANQFPETASSLGIGGSTSASGLSAGGASGSASTAGAAGGGSDSNWFDNLVGSGSTGGSGEFALKNGITGTELAPVNADLTGSTVANYNSPSLGSSFGESWLGRQLGMDAASQAIQPANVAASLGETAPSSGLSGFLSRNSEYLLPLAATGITALKSQEEVPGTEQLQQIADQQRSLVDQYASGNLSPAMQSSVDRAVQDEQTAIRSRFASLGLSGSTMEQQALADAATRGRELGLQMATNALQTGLSNLGATSNVYNAIAQNQLSQDRELSDALIALASSFGRSSGLKTA